MAPFWGVGSLTIQRGNHAIIASPKARRFARLASPAPRQETLAQDDKPLLPYARGAPTTRGEGGGTEQTQVVYIPLKLPLDSARHAPGTARGYSYREQNAE